MICSKFSEPVTLSRYQHSQPFYTIQIYPNQMQQLLKEVALKV